jgi:3-deoxy-manno-octulosonate cytidylyltransferase (CMP-KDO synthetase)
MILGLIPARLFSTRLRNKPLILIEKIPLVVHVYKRALLSKLLDKVIICGDDKRIGVVAKKYGCTFALTSKKFRNGSERISFIAKKINCKLIVDLQCDNIFLNPAELDKLIKFHLKNQQFDIVVPYAKYKKKCDPSAVKIVSTNTNKILTMSRADVPFYFNKKKKSYQRHQDFISFKKEALLKYKNLAVTKNEEIEGIELLRAIENGMNLGTLEVSSFKNVHSVNTKIDLKLARKNIKFCKIKKKYEKNLVI